MKFDEDLKVGENVTLVGLCLVTGMTSYEIKDLIEKGLPHIGGKGRSYVFNTAEVIQFKIKHDAATLREEYESFGELEEGKMSLNEAKRRREVATALKAELELANERKQVANIDDLAALFSDALINVRANLVSMPSRLSGILSHQDDETVGRLLDAEINDILENISQYKSS